VKQKLECDKPFSCILPGAFVETLVRHATEEPLEVSIGETTARVISGTSDFRSRLLEGNYPNYRQVIPKEAGERVFSLPKSDFKEALQVTSLFLAQNQVGVSLIGKKKTVEVRCGEKSHATVLGAELTGRPEMTMKVNAPYLLGVLEVLEDDVVRIECISEEEPFTIHEGNYTFLATPLVAPSR
jgi:DNA polymerase-3 subunit beta